MPCYHWHRTVVVPRDHPLAKRGRLTLKALAAYPIITYTFSFAGPSSLHEAFAKAGLTPNVAITARDADVIKTYVRLGLGVGIVAHMAIDEDDGDLKAIEASHLLPGTHHVDRLQTRHAAAQVHVRVCAVAGASPGSAPRSIARIAQAPRKR